MARLEQWLREQIEQHKVEPNSGLGEAIAYMRKHWAKLTLFLRVPGAPLDNNICERALKKAILHRKNSLFYKTQNGAHVGDVFMSLIHTAELNRVDAVRLPRRAAASPRQGRRESRRVDAVELPQQPHATRSSSRPAEVTASRWPGPHAGGHHRPRAALD